MALTRYPPLVDVSATAEATADATATALGTGDIAILLKDILTELRIHTIYLQQGLNIIDDPTQYRTDPDNQL